MRTPLIAGNWKMNKTGAEGAAMAQSLATLVKMKERVEVLLCPTYLSIPKVHEALKGSTVKLGAQDVFWETKGAFTGNVSAAMLLEYGVEYCIVGHSETRGRFGKLEIPESTVGYFSETDETVNLKIKALLAEGIAPILCVGETLAEREAGQTDQVVRKQLEGALAGIDPSELDELVIAYEPVWAIGTGKTCDTPEAERVCGMIRAELAQLTTAVLAGAVRVLYGGSVKSSNSRELFAQPNIDGGLVGGASLEAEEFSRIVLSVS